MRHTTYKENREFQKLSRNGSLQFEHILMLAHQLKKKYVNLAKFDNLKEFTQLTNLIEINLRNCVKNVSTFIFGFCRNFIYTFVIRQ